MIFQLLLAVVLISPSPDQEGNKLKRQTILIFIYPIYNHNLRNISTIYLFIYIYIYTHTHTHTHIYIYIYITRLASNKIFLPSNKIHQEVGWANDLSAPLYKCVSFTSQCPVIKEAQNKYNANGINKRTNTHKQHNNKTLF
jgi:hypothetical protein